MVRSIVAKKYYWIAINGASCAMSDLPWENPKVSPIPQQLIGFPTRTEAHNAQQITLESPIEEVYEFLKAVILRKDVKIIRPVNPQPPTDGPTIWME